MINIRLIGFSGLGRNRWY